LIKKKFAFRGHKNIFVATIAEENIFCALAA